ncbi:ABC transporter ATP-binding protein [Desulfomarina profundi]|nr:ABC transporter ATP-binding protein [Desulfomarina profundi]
MDVQVIKEKQMIQADNLSKKYGSDFALRQVSFDIGRGEIVGLLGHNGAGKTTIMKILTGFLEPTTGQVRIGGHDLAQNRRKVQEIIGYLPENCPVYPEMSVIGYLDYCASLRNLGEPEKKRRIREVLEMTGISDRAFDRIDTLSRGLRQRLGVAQALLHEPELLILDEPTNGLDPTQIGHMRQLIKELAPRATIIISTHIMQEVQAVCDRVIIIRDGEKVLDESLETLKESRSVSVALDVDNASDILEALPFVQAVRVDRGKGLSRYSLEIKGDAPDITPEIADTIMQNNWKLFELTPESRDLETIFSETMMSSGRMQ